MANVGTLNQGFVLDILQDGADQETITIASGNVTNSYDYFASPAGYIIKSIEVQTATGAVGGLLDIYKGSVAGANKVCVQVDTSTAGSQMALLAPGGSLSTGNLTITGDLLIVTSGANTLNRVLITIGSPDEKTVTVS